MNSKTWPLTLVALLCLNLPSRADDRISPTADFTVRGGVYDRISSGETALPISIKVSLSKRQNVILDIGKNKGQDTRSGIFLVLGDRSLGPKPIVAYEGEETDASTGKTAVLYWERSPTIHRPLGQATGTVDVLENDRQAGTLVLLNVHFADAKHGEVRVYGTARIPPDRQIGK